MHIWAHQDLLALNKAKENFSFNSALKLELIGVGQKSDEEILFLSMFH